MAALLVACKANAEALTFLTEAKRRLTPADVATESRHHGLAAFLAEAQLVQGVRRMAALKEGSPGTDHTTPQQFAVLCGVCACVRSGWECAQGWSRVTARQGYNASARGGCRRWTRKTRTPRGVRSRRP